MQWLQWSGVSDWRYHLLTGLHIALGNWFNRLREHDTVCVKKKKKNAKNL